VQNQDLVTHFSHFVKALGVLGVDDGIVPRDATARALRAFIRKNAFPPLLNDLVNYDEALLAIRARRSPPSRDVSAVTPRILVPHLHLSVDFPILPFITGEIDDPFMIGRRRCMYLMLAHKRAVDGVTMMEVADGASLQALIRQKQLGEILEGANDVARVIELLCSLAKMGALEWARPMQRSSLPVKE
jgi:hypothetical protein